MPAVPASVIDSIWDQFQALIHTVVDTHPYGSHRPRVADRVVFDKLVQVLVSGARVRQDRRWQLLGHHDSSAAR